MSRDKDKIVIDATGQDAEPPTLTELLEKGTESEVREALGAIALQLQNDRPLPAGVNQWLSDAFFNISRGGDPGKALRISRRGRKKIHGVRYEKFLDSMIDGLLEQGLNKTEARELVGRLDLNGDRLRDQDGASETIRKRQER